MIIGKEEKKEKNLLGIPTVDQTWQSSVPAAAADYLFIYHHNACHVCMYTSICIYLSCVLIPHHQPHVSSGVFWSSVGVLIR